MFIAGDDVYSCGAGKFFCSGTFGMLSYYQGTFKYLLVIIRGTALRHLYPALKNQVII
jgi:hypothetical protein